MLRLKDIQLYSWPLLDNWEGKAGYVWRIAPDTPEQDITPKDYLHKEDIVSTTVHGDSVAGIPVHCKYTISGNTHL